MTSGVGGSGSAQPIYVEKTAGERQRCMCILMTPSGSEKMAEKDAAVSAVAAALAKLFAGSWHLTRQARLGTLA